jgi:hypothetical protein
MPVYVGELSTVTNCCPMFGLVVWVVYIEVVHMPLVHIIFISTVLIVPSLVRWVVF